MFNSVTHYGTHAEESQTFGEQGAIKLASSRSYHSRIMVAGWHVWHLVCIRNTFHPAKVLSQSLPVDFYLLGVKQDI